MPLKKPSDFFVDKKEKGSLDFVKEELNSAAPEKIENITEAFNSFKSNLDHLQNLSDFTNTFSSFSSNVEKVNSLCEELNYLKEEIKNFIKREDIDDVVMAQILFVEKSIKTIENKIKTTNSKTLYNLNKEINEITEKVNQFIDVEIPNQKKFLLQTSNKIDSKIVEHKKIVDSRIEEIDNDISEKFISIVETLRGINGEQLEEVKSEVDSIGKKVDYFIEKDLQKYKKFFAESEIKTEERIQIAEKKVEESLNQIEIEYKNDISLLQKTLNEFAEVEIPKYKNILVESKLKSEEKIDIISESIDEKISGILNTINSFDERIKNKDIQIDEVLSNKIEEVSTFINQTKVEIENISKTHEDLNKDFKRREIYENEKLEKYSETLDNFLSKILNLEETLTKDISQLQSNLDISTSNYFDILKNEVGYFEQNISEKINDLQINFVRNETHIQNARKDLQEALSKLKLDEIEKKNKQLNEKIIHLESILEKFDEKKLLSEDSSLLVEPPSTKNKDPLTPLDQNYATIKDLQDHYRLFINRIQQQLASIGGGGAGFMYDLADVEFDRSSGNNKLLIYDQSSSKWVGIASTALSAGTSTLIGLSDVDSSNVGDGRFLRYDASSSKFTFAPVSATNLELIAGDIQSGILTTNSTGTAVIMSISASTYRSVNYQIQVTEGTNYNMTTINVIHDGTTTYMTEYGTINQPIGIATFSTDISGGSLRLLGYPAFVSDTTFKVVFTAIEA